MRIQNRLSGEIIDANAVGAYALPQYLAGDWFILDGQVEDISSIHTTAQIIAQVEALQSVELDTPEPYIQYDSPPLVTPGGTMSTSNTRAWFWQNNGEYIASIGITDGCSGGNQAACDMAWFRTPGAVTLRHPGSVNEDMTVGDQMAEQLLEAYAGERGETLVQVDNEADAWAYISGDTSKAIAGGGISTVLAGIPFPVLLIGGGLLLGKLLKGKRR